MFFPILNSFNFRQTEEVVAVISSCHLPTASGSFDFFRLRIAWQTFRHWSVPDSRSWSCFLQPFGNICNRKIMHQMCLSLLLSSLARSSENRKEFGSSLCWLYFSLRNWNEVNALPWLVVVGYRNHWLRFIFVIKLKFEHENSFNSATKKFIFLLVLRLLDGNEVKIFWKWKQNKL